MPHHGRGGTASREPVARGHASFHFERRYAGQRQGRQHAGREPALGDVDDDHAQRKRLALRAQRIGAAGIAAALFADVHALQAANQQRAHERAEQVGH